MDINQYINSFEIGKGHNTTITQRSLDLSMTLVLLIVMPVFVLFGTYSLVVSGDCFVAGMLYGFTALCAILFVLAKYRKYYPPFVFPVYLIMHAALVLGFVYHGDFIASLITTMIFPTYVVAYLNFRKSLVVITLFELVFLGSLIFSPAMDIELNFSTLYSITFAVVMAVGIAIRMGNYLILSDEATAARDNKINDSEKEIQAKNEYISQLSYQIRTPLNDIVGVSNMLNETNLTKQQKDWMETILASINNLTDVMDLIGSKVSSKKVEIKSANIAFNLQDLLKNTIQLFVGQSEEYNIALKPSQTNAFGDFNGDPIRLKQILLTLIDAIIKNKTSAKINIIISCIAEHETENSMNFTFNIKVSDVMNLAEAREVLNYSIAAGLIELLGGKLIEVKESLFTTYSFSLQFEKAAEHEKTAEKQESTKVDANHQETAAPASAPVTETPEAVKSAAAPIPVDLKNANILLVEDNLINQKIVILSIQKLVKNIDIANNGQEAVDKYLSDTKYDIVLMDIQMPIMDGLQATKKIREIEAENRATPIPVIAITANALAGDREHCLASGMNEYISKPFQVEVLVGKMKNLLQSGSPE
ncbi:MAG: response regulator [Bacteroidales bacterium]|jgi:CheY-like chemotaxis protein/signal transduction histidine kinase|nr:response regulator [Bacteroidales bacterium]